MEFIFFVKTYDSFGPCGELGRQIARGFGEIEFGLEEVSVVAWSDTTGPTKPTLGALRASFRQELAKLPSARYEITRRRLRLNYETRLNIGRDQIFGGLEGAAAQWGLLDECLGVLSEFRPKLEKKRGLEFTAFLDRLANLAASIRDAAENAPPVHVRSSEGGDPSAPWRDDFNIDWSRYHDQARLILDEPFYWDPAEEESPHAANAGSFLLGEFRRWRERHQTQAPWTFFRARFRRSGDLRRLNEFRATDPADYVERDGKIAQMHDRDVIALAFATVKIDGRCDPEIGNEALRALARRQDAAVATRLGWSVAPRTAEVASMLASKLRQCLKMDLNVVESAARYPKASS